MALYDMLKWDKCPKCGMRSNAVIYDKETDSLKVICLACGYERYKNTAEGDKNALRR